MTTLNKCLDMKEVVCAGTMSKAIGARSDTAQVVFSRLLGHIKRDFSRASWTVEFLLHATLVRPKLEYASSI